MVNLNQKLFSYIYSFAHTSAPLDSIFIFFATDFALLVAFVLLYFLYKHEDRKRGIKELVIVVGSGALAWTLAHVVKAFYPMPRPDIALQGVMALFIPNDLSSFPSGHASFYSAVAMAIYFYHKKLGYFFAGCAIIIGLARVVTGVHFPIDILAGFVLGISVAIAVHLFLSIKQKKDSS